MKKVIITTAIMGLIAVISIFSGVTMQKSHAEKYVQTKATLIYEEKKTKLPSTFTYLYSADGRKYTATKEGGISLSERNISYNKALPSNYYFGYIAPVTKVLLFIGILFAMITLFALFGLILDLPFAEKMLPCIFLYYVAGISFLTESGLATVLIALFTVGIIAVCLTVKKNNEDDYY
ncbi:MAG: hypothetical protein K2J47_01025 [Ruminococcus sp.]|nr:hypothetical protein [Ruminococcus sp.]